MRKKPAIKEWYWKQYVNKKGKKYYKKKWPITKKLGKAFEWHWKTIKNKKGQKLRIRVIKKKAE